MEGIRMKRIFGSCTILFLALVALQTIASAQETSSSGTNGLEGIWYADVTPVDCHTGLVIPNAPSFRALYMFGHDGSLENEAAFPVPNPRRSSGLGAWRHAQGQMHAGTFRFFRYNDDGSFLVLRKVTTTIVLNGDQFFSMDIFQDFDADNHPISTIGSSGCNTVTARRQ
jgi:hypothetical protein